MQSRMAALREAGFTERQALRKLAKQTGIDQTTIRITLQRAAEEDEKRRRQHQERQRKREAKCSAG